MPALLIVPTALQVQRATRRICDAQGGLLMGAAVTTLDALAARLLVAAGERRAILSPLAERLLAVEAGQAAGGPLSALSPERGLAGALASALTELRQGEVTARLAAEVAATLTGAAGERLGLLARALGRWEEGLEARRLLDRAGALAAAALAVERGLPIDESGRLDQLTVDGFTALTAAEWRLVRALVGRAGASLFRIPHFAHDPALSGPTVRLMARVESTFDLAGEREIEIDASRGEPAAPSRAAPAPDDGLAGSPLASRPAALLQALGGRRPAPWGAGAGHDALDGEVLVLPGAGEDGEVELAARTAARFIEDGIPPEEILVFAPSPGRVAARLAAAFAAHGVPLATGRPEPLVEEAPVRVLLDALALAGGATDRSTLERLAASTYLSDDAGTLELGRLLDAAGAIDGRTRPLEALRRRAASIEPGPRPAGPAEVAGAASAATGPDDEALRRWVRRTRRRDELDGAIHRVAALLASVQPLAGSAPPAAQAARLTSFVEVSGLRRRAGQGEPAVAVRDLAALSALEEAADGVVRALTLLGRGDQPLGQAAWRRLVQLAVEGATLRPGLEPFGGAVELDGLAAAAGRSTRAVILVGCEAGAVPVPIPAQPLLRDPERRALNDRLKRGALPLDAGRRAEAFHQLVCAVAAGRERVAIHWAGAGPAGGGELAPLLAEALFEPGRRPPEPAPTRTLGEARTGPEVLRAVADLARGPERAEALAALRGTGLEERAAEVLAIGDIEWERRGAVLGGASGGGAGASPWAGALTAAGRVRLGARLPAQWSARQLELFATCPFKLLVELGLGVRDEAEVGLDIDPRDEGSLFHAVLERWVRRRLERQAWPPAGDRADLDEARALAEEVVAGFERDGALGDPAVWAARREAVLTRLDGLVRAEAAAADALAPRLLEHPFGGRSEVPPLVLSSGGETVLLQGRIDRVDASAEALRVVDYKNSGDERGHRARLGPEAFGVTDFQLPLYLLAAARELPGRAASARYVLLKRQGTPVEAGAAQLPLDEARLAESVVATVRQVREGRLPIASRDCAHCGAGAVCRFQGVADAGREDQEAAP